MIITIDPYYDVQFYNECKEALRNNSVEFKEYILAKPPYYFYFEVNNSPTFINYDELPKANGKWLVNIIKSLKPNDDYIYERRDSYNKAKAIQHYAINGPLKAAEKTGEGIFFYGTKEELFRISKIYPRKIWYMGKYFKNKYKLFFTDNLIIKNLIQSEKILVESRKFKSATELEIELNYKTFRERDRLEKLSFTPYFLNGNYYPITSVRPDLTNKFIL